MLYVVPTPIGNLDDITLRAIKVLSLVDSIVAEDTRTSSVLLKHLEISKPMSSFHKFNEHQTVERLVEKMKGGENIALISDAGTPAISDPGYLLVHHAIEQGVKVECLPGATAFVPALVASGLPCDRFTFEGFLPLKKGRQSKLQELSQENKTIILYESPHRIAKTISQLKETFGDQRQGCISREISKKFEEHIRGTLAELELRCNQSPLKGEIVITIAPPVRLTAKEKKYGTKERLADN
ncbi:MAG: 16S rRNA (cytidine(1402)-2'-O)-methyltransferase [Rikenellaceae bacterium]